MDYTDTLFKKKAFLYLLALVLSIYGATYFLLNGSGLVSLVIFIPLSIGITSKLYDLVNKTNRDLILFLQGLKYNDFEQAFSIDNLNESGNILYTIFNQITEKIRNIRSEQEVRSQLMQTIIRNVDTGIYCIDKNGKCLMINEALKSLMRKSYIPKFEYFKQITPNLYKELIDLVPGQRKIVKESILNEIFQIAVQVYILRVKDEEIKVYSFYNIHNELSDQEVKSWQKLMRYLAHEIMNSIAPIASLSSSASQLFSEKDKINPDDVDWMKESFEIIKRRSNGLMKFTESYRKLTRIPPPKLKRIDTHEFLEIIHKFFERDFITKGIKWQVDFLFQGLHFDADPILLEQVFINIIKNSIEALNGCPNPKIKIVVDKTNVEKISFEILDNGKGITREEFDKIFIPFFTTKPSGSGIGLSLSQQIIRSHGGNLYLESVANKGTKVLILI